jgi:hypothetical protein
MCMNAKGSVLIPVVKTMKAEKNGAFDTYLTDEDREIIEERILPNIWYPFQTYRHCIDAIFEVIAKRNPDVAKEWGRVSCQTVMTSIYAGSIRGCNPLAYLNKSWIINQHFFDFGKTEVTAEGENRAIYSMIGFDTTFVVFYYILEGWIERGLELCGAKNIKCEFVTKSWEGHPATSMRFTWTI